MRTVTNFSHSLGGLAAASALLILEPAVAQPAEAGKVEADGTLDIPAYRLPPSEWVSDKFNKSYLEYVKAAAHWPHPPAMDAPKAEWDKFDDDANRAVFGPWVEYYKTTYPVDIIETKISGVHVAVVTPKGGVKLGNENRVIISVHGGGFFLGRGLVAGLSESMPLASIAGMKVVTIDYRMSPNYQFPAASEDVEAVYRELLKQYKPESIGMYGCSAGGLLTAQSVVWFRSKGLPRPGAVGIFCAAPGISGKDVFGKRGDSSMWTSTGLPWNEEFTREVGKFGSIHGLPYLRNADLNDPRAYPGMSDEELAKFPPSLFVTGTRASDLSPSSVAHAKFLKLGVDSQLYVQEGGTHGSFLNAAYNAPEARDVWTYIARWFDQKLQK